MESGTLWVGDPCYLIGKLKDFRDWVGLVGGLPDPATHDAGTDEPLGAGLGVWISSLGGDGVYGLTIEWDENGRVLSLSMQFAPPGDEL